jgi:hypothetical protein
MSLVKDFQDKLNYASNQKMQNLAKYVQTDEPTFLENAMVFQGQANALAWAIERIKEIVG